jgi:O-antigen/teichoic acid export membrane protein
MVEGTSRILCMIAAFIASFLYLFSDHLITIIYGHGRFEQAAEILRVNAIFVPLLFFVMLLSSTLWALGRSNAMVAISLVRVSFCAIASWFLIGLFQEKMGNGAIGLVIIAGMAEVPAIAACLAVLPRGVIGYAVILNFVRAYVAAIGVVVIVAFLEPLTLWYTATIFILTFAIVATATRLVLLSDLRVAVNIARSKIFSR